jgi:hypothetical protein
MLFARCLLSAVLLVTSVAPFDESNATSFLDTLRPCSPPPSSDLATFANPFGFWLGCYSKPVSDPGWTGLRFDKGFVAETTASPKVRVISYSIREYVWMVLQPLEQVFGGDVQRYVAKAPCGTLNAGVGDLAALNGCPSEFNIGLEVVSVDPAEAGGAVSTSLPALVTSYTAYQLPLEFAIDPKNSVELGIWKTEAKKQVLKYEACWRHAKKAYTLAEQGAEDFVSTVIAKLAVVDAQLFSQCDIDGLIGENRPLLQQAEDALVNSQQYGLPGTSSDDIPGCHRDGEYDTAMWGLVRIVSQFGHLLQEATKDHILNTLLSGYDGRWHDDPSFTHEGMCGLEMPESENHILLLESSRYIANNLKRNRLGPAASTKYDNVANGQQQWMLRHLQRFVEGGFYEYNGIPYQRYTYYALANLADLVPAGDPVKDAARIVIKYLDAKFVLSTANLRRHAPFRRRNEDAIKGSDTFLGSSDDPQAGRWIYFSGRTVSTDNETQPIAPFAKDHGNFRKVHWWQAENLLLASITSQQPTDFLISQFFASRSAPYFQAFTTHGSSEDKHFTMDKSGYEIYWNDENFLISAGGSVSPHGYDYSKYPPRGGSMLDLGVGLIGLFSGEPLAPLVNLLTLGELKEKFSKQAADEQNKGIARSTMLLPRLTGVRRSELLQFLGSPADPRNSCVGPNFLCGTRPVVPNAFVSLESCARYRFAKQEVQAYWETNKQDLGCPVFGSEGSNGSDHWISFANGAFVIRFNSMGQIAYTLTAKVQYAAADQRLINLTFHGPARDFHIIRYQHPGDAKVTQQDLGRTRGFQATDIDYQISGRPGAYSISMEGCYFATLDSNCPDGFLPPLAFEVRQSERQNLPPTVCSGQMPEQTTVRGNTAVIEFGTSSREGCEGAVLVGLYVSPCHMQETPRDSDLCGEAGGSYGFAEALSASGRSEDMEKFARQFAQNNQTKLFTFSDQSQSFTTITGSTFGFLFHPPDRFSWAIRSLSTTRQGAATAATLSTDISSWPIATGAFMNSGNRTFGIDNPYSGEHWDLDLFDEYNPKVPPG